MAFSVHAGFKIRSISDGSFTEHALSGVTGLNSKLVARPLGSGKHHSIWTQNIPLVRPSMQSTVARSEYEMIGSYKDAFSIAP